MAKALSLQVHRNRIEARRKRDIGRDISHGIAKKVRDADIRAFAFVGIDAKGAAHCLWDTGKVLPLWGFPHAVAAMLQNDIEAAGIKEDWKPPLP